MSQNCAKHTCGLYGHLVKPRRPDTSPRKNQKSFKKMKIGSGKEKNAKFWPPTRTASTRTSPTPDRPHSDRPHPDCTHPERPHPDRPNPDSPHKILERKTDLAVRGEKLAQQRLYEPETYVEVKYWEKRNSDTALYEINLEFESHQLQLQQAN